ncbi:hypothetical protein ACJMK2_037147 [Sinanodonta woodiana]|uniref:Protein cornichon homolog 4 n=1 Tax=Sinanodonta woodiana TaxID=1069815 RepID=A0ABD3WJD4_SINWO
MGFDGPLFTFALLDEGALLCLVVYFIVTLSDLECDYLNATSCCDKLNYWIIPELVAQVILTSLLLVTGHVFLFIFYAACTGWLVYSFAMKPSGNIGLYDPTEIHNKMKLKVHMKENLIKMGFHLVFFFIYLYMLIYSLLKKDDE